jgi:hypothetical protein
MTSKSHNIHSFFDRLLLIKLGILAVLLLCGRLSQAQAYNSYPDVIRAVYLENSNIVVIVKESYRDWKNVYFKIKPNKRTKFTLVINSIHYDCVYWSKQYRHYIKIERTTYEIDPLKNKFN